MSSTGQGASDQGAADDTAADTAARERAQVLAERNEYRQAYRRDKAKSQTVGNMVFALAICLAVVAFLVLVTWRPHKEEVKAIEYTAQLEDAKKVAAWVRGPEPMPSGWSATSVEFRTPQQEPITWHLGVVTAARKYVGLEQSNVTTGKFLGDKLGRTSDDGTAAVNGVTWQRKILLDRKGETALVLVGAGTTTIVTGNAGYPDLEAFASVLH
ncbi:DUF4245 domain-containing protein [Kribbella solani]|uniref:DUF4245 domain-containing protein n=1 Tax=Kribbella solani TaxID=236067 RepID=A0A841E502_9ACTN|nr:DUF4245 domain-containing protein [Kribbella solani]MBB5983457.1 hypothetical protein [Kribbella solani]MDX2971896.1 DUF4245 domain-containing protein [Kribbella solani]MDX3006955.1 DUF4245 domain-containing protein [Kribbella solani]